LIIRKSRTAQCAFVQYDSLIPANGLFLLRKSMMLVRIGSSQPSIKVSSAQLLFTLFREKGRGIDSGTEQQVHWPGGAQALPPEGVASIKCLSLLPKAMFNWPKGKLMDAQHPIPHCSRSFTTRYCQTPFGCRTILPTSFFRKAEKSDNEIFRIQK
jgi:hypothetical protein